MIAAALRRAWGGGDRRSPAQIDGDIRDEFEFHLAMLDRDVREGGVAPDGVRAESERRFGNIEALRRRCRAEALKERFMLQKITIALLAVIAGALVWGLVVSRQQLASMSELAQAMRHESEVVRVRALEAEAAARRAAPQIGVVYVEGPVICKGAHSLTQGLSLRRVLAAACPTGQPRTITVTNSDAAGAPAVRFELSGADFRRADGPDIELKPHDIIRVVE